VRWLDAADFQLSDGTGGPPVSLAGVSLESSDNTNWTFTGLSSLLAANRTYTLTHTNPSKVTDEAGRPVSGGIPAFRFFVYNGGASNDSAWLAATASAIVIYANGSPTPSYTLPAGSVDQILVSGAAGNDTLVDQIPASMRPARGVAFHGGAGASDYANIQGSSANDTIDAHLGSVTVQPAGSPAGLTEYDAETVEILAIAANAGIDTIRVHDLTLSVYLDGGDGDDVIDLDYSASGLSPSVAGGAGNDTIHGSPGNDYIAGNTGDDTIYGYAGADQVYGDDPSGSAVTGSPGVDNLYGGEGNDTLYGDGYGYGVTGNSDYLYGDDGDDTLHGDDGDGGSGATATGTHDYYALGGSDRLEGGAGNDALFGEDGDDNYVFHYWGLDSDTVSEFAYGGTDWLDFQNFSQGVSINLANDGTTQTVASDLSLRLASGTRIENVRGTAQGDVITGNYRQNQLWGFAGNDTIRGGDADDFLFGGAGSDLLYGENGLDYIDPDDHTEEDDYFD